VNYFAKDGNRLRLTMIGADDPFNSN